MKTILGEKTKGKTQNAKKSKPKGNKRRKNER